MQERLTACRIERQRRMVELNLKKITAPDFSVSIRPGLPSLMVIDEDGGAQHLYRQPSAQEVSWPRKKNRRSPA